MGGKIRIVTPKTEQKLNPKSLKAIKIRIGKAVKENSDFTGRAAIDDVVTSLTAQGYTEAEVRKDIDCLLERGDAMEPKKGIIKII